MKRTVSALRKIVILLIGLPILIVGIILIPLPGPGILMTFAGLFILSLEFDFARKHVDRFRDLLEKIMQKARDNMENGRRQ